MSVRKPPIVQDHVPTHGTRTPRFIVLHTTEGGGTVESLARYFRSTPDGLGSTFLIEPDGRIGQYARLDERTYHVRSHNSEMLGIEQIGHASTSRKDWLGKYRRELFATAWTLAWLSEQLGIPLIIAANDRRQMLHKAGVLQHSQVPDNDHNDCGAGYPVDFVMKFAQKWLKTGGPALATRIYIKTGQRPQG